MSLFIPVRATCPACGTSAEADLAASVNADRRPDLRASILDGTFQAKACPSCAAAMRMPAHLSYLDVGRRQWVLVEDTSRLSEWRAVEVEATALYDSNFGPNAPAPQRAVMEGVAARLVFGWAALREKLITRQAGLDDVLLELLKVSVLRRVPSPPFRDGIELRLVGAEDETLEMAWLDSASERFVAALSVPREAYRDIAADPEPWHELRQAVSGGLFVDMARMVLA